MESPTQSYSSNVKIKFDHNTPERIVILDRNLRSLRAEIEVKIHNFSVYEGENKEMYLNQLNTLITEIDSAINGVETLVKMVNTYSDEEQHAFYGSELMQKFYGVVTEQLTELGQLKKKM